MPIAVSYVPKGWKMRAESRREFLKHRAEIDKIVKQCARKYFRLPSIDPEDLEQDGRMAAAYAIDTFDVRRGKNLYGYVNRVVYQALAMVAGISLAKKRHPHVHVRRTDGKWEEVPAAFSGPSRPDGREGEMPIVSAEAFQRQERVEEVRRRARYRRQLDEIWVKQKLSKDAAVLLEIRRRPPAGLCVAARNMNNGRHDINMKSIAFWTGWTLKRVQKAHAELVAALKRSAT